MKNLNGNDAGHLVEQWINGNLSRVCEEIIECANPLESVILAIEVYQLMIPEERKEFCRYLERLANNA